MKLYDLAGEWQCRFDGEVRKMHLPGSLDESGIGHPDLIAAAWHPDEHINAALATTDMIATRFTRRYTCTGAVEITKRIDLRLPEGKRLFVRVERARALSLYVNGNRVEDAVPPALSTPRLFEVTGLLHGDDELCFVSDNSYPGWPREDILFSSAATDETQTNWNGLLGEIAIHAENACFVSFAAVYPRKGYADVYIEINGRYEGCVSLECEAFCENIRCAVPRDGWIRNIALKDDIRYWDTDEGKLYSMKIAESGLQEKQVTFGVRYFGSQDGKITLNGRKLFIRQEANCAVFPETGYEPMDEEKWAGILKTYRSYGVNCIRFHSHTPPEAAFAAADRLGMLMQPELNCWNPRTAFTTREQCDYYENELIQTQRMLANHPSFMALTLGNELNSTKAGLQKMAQLILQARRRDPSRLYAIGSNVGYGHFGANEADDYYTSASWKGARMRGSGGGMNGYINREQATAKKNYDETLHTLRQEFQKPVISFEVGQYEVLPDLSEIERFHGVLLPNNLKLVRQHVREKGLEQEWERRVSASGELSLLCYREEVEAAMRTRDLAGISLLGLQDFPGQGTALVGMLNSHLQPKGAPFAQPERFARFFRDTLPLALMEKYTYTMGEEVRIPVKLFHYGKTALHGRLKWSLGPLCAEGEECTVCSGTLSDIGTISLRMPASPRAQALKLRLSFAGYENEYPLWCYPDVEAIVPPDIFEAHEWTEAVKQRLADGGKVLLSVRGDIETHFSTDFWSVGTFPQQSGTMGQLIDASHPLFRAFPTEEHTSWQWHEMARQGAMRVPRGTRCMITQMDSYAYLRDMAQLFECRCANGRLIISTLQTDALMHLPEARCLKKAILDYMTSEAFAPEQEFSMETLEKILQGQIME